MSIEQPRRRPGLRILPTEDGATAILRRTVAGEGPPAEPITDIATARFDRRILPDAQAQFERLLAGRGLEHIREVSIGDNAVAEYPTVDDWIEWRIQHGMITKFFPCFVRTAEGETVFLKVQITAEDWAAQSLERESQILRAGLPTGTVARFIELPTAPAATDQELHFIGLQAIPISMGETRPIADWNVEQAQSAAARLQQLEEFDLAKSTADLSAITRFESTTDEQGALVEMVEHSREFLSEDLADRLVQFLRRDTLPKVLTHGDAVPKNFVLIGDTVELVDWEHCGRRMLGRDAGKLYNHLRTHRPVAGTFLEHYIQTTGELTAEQRRYGLAIGMIRDNLDNIAWRVHNILRNPAATSRQPRARQEIEAFSPLLEEALTLAGA